MIDSTTPVPLDQHRRAKRALHLFADILGGGHLKEVSGMGSPLPETMHLPRLRMDIAVTRDPAPMHMRQILAYARRRQLGFILVRFRDPVELLAEALLDVVLCDGPGLAVLDGLSPATSNGNRWHLVARHSGGVHLRVTGDGLVPTLTDPWVEEDDRHSFVSNADRILAEYLWRD